MIATFELLAEPNRRRILDLLLDGDRPVGELVDRLGMSQPSVSKHLRVLRESGLVDVRTDAQRRVYRLRRSRSRKSMRGWSRTGSAGWTGSTGSNDISRPSSRPPEGDAMTRPTRPPASSGGSSDAGGIHIVRVLDAGARPGVQVLDGTGTLR